MMPPAKQNHQAQESLNKFGQLTRKPLNAGASLRNQPSAPIRSSAQNAPGPAKPEGTNGAPGGNKSPAGDSSFLETGNGERGILRRGEREPRGGRGMGVRGGLTRANGVQSAGKASEAGKTDVASPATGTETPAVPAETTDKPAAEESTPSADDKTEEAWGAAVATITTAAATGLPPARASRLVEKNPHTLYVKGLPQPCTDEELRGLWKEDVRGKVSFCLS